MNTPTPTPALYLALELSNKSWKLGFSVMNHAKLRRGSIKARDLASLLSQVQRAREHFGLSDEVPVYSVYEAGRDGFWLHRALEAAGVQSMVIDPGSIERPRRKTAKTDRLDVELLMNRLLRWHTGDRKVWKKLRVPSREVEAQREYHREWRDLKGERSALICKVRSALVRHGITVGRVDRRLKDRLGQMRCLSGVALDPRFVARLEHTLDRLGLLDDQIKGLEQARKQRLAKPSNAGERRASKLARLKSLGPVTSEGLSQDFFWRNFDNRRQVGGASGLTGTPYDSGDSRREAGISKQGNPDIRTLCVELAWLWLRHQPDSALSRWYQRRFGEGGPRQRRIGIVALARKLLVALWKYLEHDEVPEGAVFS